MATKKNGYITKGHVWLRVRNVQFARALNILQKLKSVGDDSRYKSHSDGHLWIGMRKVRTLIVVTVMKTNERLGFPG